MKKLSVLLSAIIITSLSVAQNPHNLVPNHSFEEVEKKIKDAGSIHLAEGWRSVNMNPVDLYSVDSKNGDFGVPENKYGKEKARTGNNYAGISFYGYKGKEPRTYLGTRLKNPLMAGKQYCMKFHVSLSDMSKYAVNNLAMYVTSDSVAEMSEKNLAFEPQIMSVINKPFEKQFLWTPICGTYTAKGGEQHIIIGNFFPDAQTKQETIRLSREFSGRQAYNAYYFIDDISVIMTEKLTKKDCACDDIAGGAMEVEFKQFSTDETLKSTAKKTYLVNSDGTRAEESIKKEKEEVKEEVKKEGEFKKFSSSDKSEEIAEVNKVEKKAVYSPADVTINYVSMKFKAGPAETEKLQKIAAYLKSNSKKKLIIKGHEDSSESEVAFLAKRRAFMIEKELKILGVSANQLEYVDLSTSDPASETDAKKNMRVTFELK